MNTAPIHSNYPHARSRRLRSSHWIRDIVSEHQINTSDLIWPVFVIEGQNTKEDIESMPGVYRYSIDLLVEEAKKASDIGIQAIGIFPSVASDKKTEDGAEASNPDNLICRALSTLKKAVPHVGLIADVALDPYTTHGHDGVLKAGQIDNDETLPHLAQQALIQAQAGADVIAPSDMMDGRIKQIRETLESNRMNNTLILSYAAKYASGFYGPFRDAVGSGHALKGDKKTYQMNPANSDEALREVAMDIREGADMIMIKPGLPYLDITYRIKDTFAAPTFAYHVSGEYAMLKAAAHNKWLDYETCLMETLVGFKRAGCDGILTYGARDAAMILSRS